MTIEQYSIKWYFLRWLRGPANMAQGFAQTISLGFWEPMIALKVEIFFLNESDKMIDKEPELIFNDAEGRN